MRLDLYTTLSLLWQVSCGSHYLLYPRRRKTTRPRRLAHHGLGLFDHAGVLLDHISLHCTCPRSK